MSDQIDDEGQRIITRRIKMTDRVEINPDNNNKTLEQSQEDLAKQGINVNESQVNNNGESINISQPENKHKLQTKKLDLIGCQKNLLLQKN